MIDLLVLQPTSFCNIDCRYCYLSDRSDRRRMNDEILHAIGRNIINSASIGRELTVVWHAGEPLVLPADWYAKAFSLLERYRPAGVRITHAFQTNGTLVDGSWVRFFRQPNTRVGVSLDGPEHLHDLNRRTRRGRGTFGAAVSGMRLIRDAGIPFHVITVLTAISLTAADQLFDFYLSEGIERVCFNIEEIEGQNRESSLRHPQSDVAYAQFMQRIVDRLERSPRPIWIREIARGLDLIRMPPDQFVSNEQVTPLAIVSVDTEGSMSTFSPELSGMPAPDYNNFRFGNVMDGGTDNMIAQIAFQRAHADIGTGVEACKASCSWFRLCGGGAPANKISETGSLRSTETMACRLYTKSLISVLLDSVDQGHFQEGNLSHA